MSFQAPPERYLEDDSGIVTSGVRGERYSLTDALTALNYSQSLAQKIPASQLAGR